MAPPIVQDSDDEEALLASPEPTAEFHPYSLPEKLPMDPSTGSTEVLANELRLAHENLVAPSPDLVTLLPHGSGTVSPSLRSPTMSMIKRSRTTMDELKSQPKRKPQRIYGNKTTLDDLGLCQAIVEGDWLQKSQERQHGSAQGLESEILSLVPSKKRKRETSTYGTGRIAEEDHNPSPLYPAAFCFSQTGKAPLGILQSQESSCRNGSATLSQVVDSALEDLQAIDDNKLSSEQERAAGHNETKLSSCVASQQASPSSRTSSRLSEAFTDDELSNSRLPAVQRKGNGNNDGTLRVQIDVLSDRDELEVDRNDPLETLSKQDTAIAKSKRKPLNSSQEDELAIEIFGEEPPKEAYQPRPTRSRGSALPDPFPHIDFSKRPEAAMSSRSKIKRRKTTGDIAARVDDDDQDSKNLEQVLESNVHLASESKDSVERVVDVQKKKRGRPKKPSVEVVSIDVSAEEPREDDLASTVQGIPLPAPALLPGKKRGRKKKVEDTLLVGNESPGLVAPEDSPCKYSNKEEQRADSCTAAKNYKSDLFVCDDEDNGDDANEDEKSKDTKTPGNPAALRDNLNVSNTMLSAPTASNHSVDMPTQSAAYASTDMGEKSAAIETPKKAVVKTRALDKHSPLSSAKMNYRVGLSRHARIEPLLRIVRK